MDRDYQKKKKKYIHLIYFIIHLVYVLINFKELTFFSNSRIYFRNIKNFIYFFDSFAFNNFERFLVLFFIIQKNSEIILVKESGSFLLDNFY